MSEQNVKPEESTESVSSGLLSGFLLFCGACYYPAGGWGDFIGAFDTLEAAKDRGQKEIADWRHVINLKTGEMTELR